MYSFWYLGTAWTPALILEHPWYTRKLQKYFFIPSLSGFHGGITLHMCGFPASLKSVICFLHYFKHIYLVFTGTGNVFGITHSPSIHLVVPTITVLLQFLVMCSLNLWTAVWTYLSVGSSTRVWWPLRVCLPEGNCSLLKQSLDINGFSDGAELLKSMLGIWLT